MNRDLLVVFMAFVVLGMCFYAGLVLSYRNGFNSGLNAICGDEGVLIDNVGVYSCGSVPEPNYDSAKDFINDTWGDGI